MIDLRQRPHDLNRVPGRIRESQHPQVCSVDAGVRKERASSVSRHALDAVRHRQRDVLAGREIRLSLHVDELRIPGGASELGLRSREVVEIVQRRLHQLGRRRAQRFIDGATELAADDEVDDQGCSDDGQRNGRGSDQCESSAKAHGSRSA
jgi:hypothetical protein